MKDLSSREFFEYLQESEEGREYCTLVNNIRLENRSPKEYRDGFEIHHIHPRALGGDLSDSNNLIKVSCFEHCKLHVLLAKAIRCYETLKPVLKMNTQQFGQCSDLEKITLEDLYKWSNLREEAKKLGHSEETRKKIGIGNKGKHVTESVKKRMSELAKGKNTWTRGLVWINNGIQMKRVSKDILGEYLKGGWIRGELKRTEEVCEKISKRMKGKNTWSAGRIRIHRENVEKVVRSEELEKFLQEGWKKGTSDKTRKQISESSIGKKGSVEGRIRIHNKFREKLVTVENLDFFLNSGWQIGSLRKSRTGI